MQLQQKHRQRQMNRIIEFRPDVYETNKNMYHK
jgi:hypothetical protein